jgi:peptide/nickel transport system ATP-binding protein
VEAVNTVLSVENLRTEFRMRTANVVAVDGVSFEVNQGECVGIVGESGCGKSTTGFSIMRLLPINGHLTNGRILLNGRDLADLSEKEMQGVRGDEVALIPQDPLTSLNPTMTIGRQIGEAVRLHREVTRQQVRDRALEVLSMVEMPRPAERLDQYPHELSGGLRQRVMIAMALACEPKLLIADEPTTALDVTIQAQILDLIDDLRERLRMAVLLITHDMGVIAGRTDRVVVMYAGKVAEEASTRELFRAKRHPYSEALLASVPRLDQARSDRLVSIAGLPPDLSQTITNCRFAPRCRYATDVCREQEPPLNSDGAPVGDHRFACFHPVSLTSRPEPLESELAAEPAGTAPVVALPGAADERETARATLVEDSAILMTVSHLTKEFPVMAGLVFRHKVGSVKAVSDISFQLHQGETFGLVGESGCGKTTVGRLLVSLEQADAGSITFGGTDLTTLGRQDRRATHRDIQLMFQDPYASLDPRMRVGSIIEEPLIVQDIGTAAERKTRVKELLGEVGLSSTAVARYPHEFSGGQRQRIGFARALALDPKLVVADEPVSALDVSIQAQLLNVMKDLQARHGLTYIMISHDLAVVRYMADTIGVMYLGKLVEMGPAAEVYDHPAHPYTQGLLDAVPVPEVTDVKAARLIRVPGELPSAVDPPSGCRFRTRCPRAQELCAQEEPAMSTYANGHVAACHYPLQTPVHLASSVPAAV